MRVRWDVYPSEPAAPFSIATPHGRGDTPADALADLRAQIEFERARAAEPVTYYDELLERLQSAD